MAATAAVPPRAVAVRAVAALVLATTVAGCQSLLNDDQELPGTARVEVTGNAAEDLELVTSIDFFQVDDLEAGGTYNELVQADTALIRPDFAEDYGIATTHRFFVRLTNHATDVADISLTVSFDGAVEYTQQATLSEGGALEFSEIFFGT